MKRIMHNALQTAVLSVLLLTVTAGYAQTKQYPYVQYGKIIVCREGSDGVKSTLIHPNWTTTPSHNELDGTNNRFAAKFEVGGHLSTSALTWTAAVSACASYVQNGNMGWRVPTVRELRLIFACRNELTSCNIYADVISWSATWDSTNGNLAWGVHLESGHVFSNDKTTTYRVCCVRDL